MIVDDQRSYADYLAQGLVHNGFSVDIAADGVQGRDLALGRDYSLVVLDLRLPGLDGFSVLKAVRQQKATPVIVVTGLDSLDDKVTCLQSGADDYLIKPIAMSEFLARVGLHVRRGCAPSGSGARLEIADLVLDLSRKRAERSGQRLDLTRKEFALLMVLLEHPGEVVSRDVIAERVWNVQFDATTNIIDVAIRRLRRKLDDPYASKLLHTVRGLGYVLEER
ncbi:DNA-binding response regulator [Pseudorhodoferax aquiterrae]|uniref:DNA-binding response regulator n=1 Tax=Pseudorhodoferax aquiterrae TaxID=747304 RepID=A0ABQ3G6F1_9BURK|nr:DNA-binding response regulator [Pseudorhodoferax aquiterrae]